eukprot:CAMPEP_0202694724 /NCGR_PEP_ID=MMETSP1385-20130828/8513_1 /ASSEMBLY_ACC=CAM_ASM_000861 /TAXON_ID=933848 /ORGANISM="Elphidium margaritaceum" /LENGTH=623 /DNA_ID=CAMNT_0049350623 /DNA_START=26 /DNA_END=1897 /DNA_ORIENTATION=-
MEMMATNSTPKTRLESREYGSAAQADDDDEMHGAPRKPLCPRSVFKVLLVFIVCLLLYSAVGVTYLLTISDRIDTATASTAETSTDVSAMAAAGVWDTENIALRSSLLDTATAFFNELAAMLTTGDLEQWTQFASTQLANDFVFVSDLTGVTYSGLTEFLDDSNGFHVGIIGTFDVVTSIVGANLVYRAVDDSNSMMEIVFPVRTRLTRNECPASGLLGVTEEETDVMALQWSSSESQWKIASFASQGGKIDIETCSATTEEESEDTTEGETTFCDTEDYFKDALNEEYTAGFGAVLMNQSMAMETTKSFEASGVVYDSRRNVYWAVFDSLWSLGMIHADLTRSEENVLVRNAEYESVEDIWDESGFEGIAWDADSDMLYLLTEGVEFEDNDGEEINLALLRTVIFDGTATYMEQQLCAIDFEFESDNKGFEAVNIIEIDGVRYFLALCEGNHCRKSDAGRDAGNGRVVLFEFQALTLNSSTDSQYQYLMDMGVDCLYPTVNVFELPSYINFTDYAGMHFRHIEANLYDVAIVSQTDAAVWIGAAEWSLTNGPNFTVSAEDSKTYQLPKGGQCETIFCNVEGVSFTDNYNQLMMVSDRAKGGGDQPWICGGKDQSLHLFKYRA